MYNFVHSSVIYNVIVTSVYTPCIYTFYKSIYKNIWTIHHDQCLLKVLMYILALFLLFFYHLDGFKLWPFGRNQPVLVRKLSWDWMSITGWRYFCRWTHWPPVFSQTRSATCLFWPSCLSTPSALVFAPSHMVTRVVLLLTSGRCCEDVVFAGMSDFLLSHVGTLKQSFKKKLVQCICVLLHFVCCKVPSK